MMPREEGAMAQKVAFLLWDTIQLCFSSFGTDLIRFVGGNKAMRVGARDRRLMIGELGYTANWV
jgi:hypothetical protein